MVLDKTNRTALSLAECYKGIHLGIKTRGEEKDDQFRHPQKDLVTLLVVRGYYPFKHSVRFLKTQWGGP